MSGRFKSVIAPLLSKLNTHVTTANTTLALEQDQIGEDQVGILKKKEKQIRDLLVTLNKWNGEWIQYINTVPAAEKEGEDAKYDQYKVNNKHFYTYMVDAKETLDNIKEFLDEDDDESEDGRQSPAQPAPRRRNDDTIKVNLPKLTLPEFKGDPHQWLSFWQCFEASIDSENFKDVDKMRYLFSCLSGKAKDAVADLPLTNTNYKIAVDTLKQRFGDQKILKEALMAKLLKLPPARNDRLPLKVTVEEMEKIFRQLTAMGESIDNPVLISMIKSKLPEVVLLKIATEEREAGVDWGMKKLRNFLIQYVAIKDSVYQSTLHFHEKSDDKTHKPKMEKSDKTSQSTRTFATTIKDTAKPRLPCVFCEKQGHFPHQCRKFAGREDRMKRLFELRRCYKCLRLGHHSKECRTPKNCRICNAQHNTALCTQTEAKPKSEESGTVSVPTPPQIPKLSQNKKASWSRKGTWRPTGSNAIPLSTHLAAPIQEEAADGRIEVQETSSHFNLQEAISANAGDVVLMASYVPVYSPTNPQKLLTALIFWDSGSQSPYITHKLIKELKPPKVAEGVLEVSVFQGQQPICFRSGKYVIGLQRTDGKQEEMVVFSAKPFTRNFRAVHLRKLPRHPSLEEVKKNLVMVRQEPDIMIGLVDFWRFFVSRTELGSDMYLIQTVFGPVVCGRSQLYPAPERWRSHTHMSLNVSKTNQTWPSEDEIKSWWDLQSIGIRDSPAENDGEIAMQKFQKSLRQVNGRYRMKWLWREDDPQLPSNYNLAYKCLESVYRRLQSQPELLQKCDDTIREQLRKGIIEVAERRQRTLEHFLPHHPVVTHKVRLVYNASAKLRNGLSLNDCLYQGPDLLPDLTGLLMRFRLPKYPLWFDIEKAFLQLELEVEDREVVKFLWVKDPSKPLSSANLIIYRFCRVAFGVNCSPFLLAGTIQHHLKKYSDRPLTHELMKNAYVDNFLVSCETEAEIHEVYRESKEIFQAASMNLREYVSNCSTAMKQIPPDERLAADKPKILGLHWILAEDKLEIKMPNAKPTQPVTRRAILSEMASIFDPLGLTSPCVVQAKVAFQNSWNAKTTWDDQLPEEMSLKWSQIRKDWQDRIVIIPRRCIHSQQNCCFQLHAFVDASIHMYAVAVYLRSHNLLTDEVGVSLIFVKNRLKPRSTNITIPRMELLGLQVGVRAIEFVSSELGLEIASKFVWSDSKIILSWVNSDSDETKPRFVANRLREIRKNTSLSFGYVPSEENPADIATRGLTPDEIQRSKLWWNGPEWLAHEDTHWPKEMNIVVLKPEDAEPENLAKHNQVITMSAMPSIGVDRKNRLRELIDVQKFSNWVRLIRTVEVVMRYCYKKLQKSFKSPTNGASKREELVKLANALNQWEIVEKLILKITQEDLNKAELKKEMFKDENGLIRIHARINQSETNTEFHSPIVIPKYSDILPLLILHIHRKHFHSGVESTLTNFLCLFWTPQARRTIKSVLKKCHHCRRMKAYPFQLPAMPQLPRDRVTKSSPFTSIGVDLLGPTLFREDGKTHKVWIVIITCLATRAVYLEPVKDQTTHSFLFVFRRFVARRGRPEKVLSDNGSQLVQAAKICEIIVRDPTKSFVWKFINQLSPWQGATYERLIALVKGAFRRTFGRQILGWEELCTIVAEIEATLNLRPLTTVKEIPERNESNFLPLRPIDFLLPNRCLEFSAPSSTISGTQLRDKLVASWANTIRTLEEFWKVWNKDYLIMLRERSPWHHKGPRLQTKRQPKVGEVVLIEEDLRPRNLWNYGRITELLGDPNAIRNVKKLTSSGRVLSRPINRLYPLELDSEPKQPLSHAKNTEQNQKTDERLKEVSNNTLSSGTQPNMMITRSKAKALASTTTLTLVLVLSLFSNTSALERCQECTLSCVDQGIHIIGPHSANKVEVCCNARCMTKSFISDFVYELDREFLLKHYQCEVTFWANNFHDTLNIHCEPKNGCATVDCYLCWNFLENPHCWPDLAAMLYGVFLFLSFIGFCVLFTFVKMAINNTRSICYSLIVVPIQFVRHLCQRQRENKSSKRMRTQQKRPTTRRRTLSETEVLLVTTTTIFLFGIIVAQAEVTSINATTVECVRQHSNLTCIVEASPTLTMLSNAEQAELMLRNDKSAIIGNLKVITRGLDMYCVRKTNKWLRSYKVETATIKRCPAFGSCQGDYCDKVFPNTSVSELKEWEKHPGNNHCMGTCSFVWCNCPTVTAGCLFYRTFAIPNSEDVFELFECSDWEFLLSVRLELSLTGEQKVAQTDMILHPTMSDHWEGKNVTLVWLVDQHHNHPPPSLGKNSYRMGKQLPWLKT